MKVNFNNKYLTNILLMTIVLIGVSYAFFNYLGVGKNRELIAGDVYLNMDESNGFITLSNVFPETKEEARSRTDNTVTFTISGTNTTTNHDIWYEILLNEGEIVEGKTRFNANDLVFDLVEINGDTETYLVDSMSFNSIDAKRIWVDKVASNETSFTKTYRLRVWLSDKVLISDIDPNATYPASTYKNMYTSIKVSVYGDFEEKMTPYNYMYLTNTFTGWPTAIENQKSYITAVNFINMQSDVIDERYNAATIKADLTNTIKANGGKVYGWLENGELVTADDGTETQYYIMYVASEGITFLPSNCNYMFYYFTNLTSVNFDNINTRNVTNMSSMFSYCSSLTSLDVSNFDTSKVTTMSSMFGNCSKLASLDLSNFDTSKVTNMYGMFQSCSNLTSLDLSSFDTSNVTSMGWMFRNCSSLTSLDLSNFDTYNVTNMDSMFYHCSSLISAGPGSQYDLNLSNFDTSNVTNMSGMFAYCSSVTSLDLSNFDTRNVTTMKSMFASCSSLISAGPGSQYDLNLNNFDTSNVTDMSYMFESCSRLTCIDLNNFDTSKVTSMSFMFRSCSKLAILDISNFDTSNVKVMNSIFYYCSSLTSLNLSNFDTSHVTTMECMFYRCSSLTSLDLSNFDTSKVTEMNSMFYYCSSLTSLNLSNFDTIHVTTMECMFYRCSSLTTIYANTDWNTTTVTSSGSMFYYCTKLVGAISYDSSKIDVTYANPTTGYFTVKTV